MSLRSKECATPARKGVHCGVCIAEGARWLLPGAAGPTLLYAAAKLLLRVPPELSAQGKHVAVQHGAAAPALQVCPWPTLTAWQASG